MAATARMTTPAAVGVPLRAGIAAIGFLVHYNGAVKLYDAKAIGAGTFHLGHSCHGGLLIVHLI